MQMSAFFALLLMSEEEEKEKTKAEQLHNTYFCLSSRRKHE